MLASAVSWNTSLLSAGLALSVLACVGAVLRTLWAEARSVQESEDPSEKDDPSTSGNTGKSWDFELQPVPAEPHESVGSDGEDEDEDEDELVIWVDLEDDEDENGEEDSLGEDYGKDEDADPWEWPDTRDAG